MYLAGPHLSRLKPPAIMHVDMNSCFATIEQQANPLYRHRPLVVAAYARPFGCILAASYEAKRLGIKTGMRVGEGKAIHPSLIVLEPDPDKYRFIHEAIKDILQTFTPKVLPKSIDEFVLDFSASPATHLFWAAQSIKDRIRCQVGEYLTVSVGIGTNRFLAKTAADFQKPDGLTRIDQANIKAVFGRLELTDLCGISTRTAVRLHAANIFTALDFLEADLWQLKSAFKSILAEYWYLRLRGFELDHTQTNRKTVGNSYILPQATPTLQTAAVMAKLIHKMSQRLRAMDLRARGIHLAVSSPDGRHWHRGELQPAALAAPQDFYPRFYRLLKQVDFPKAKGLAVTSFDLLPADALQLNLFTDVVRPEKLAKAMDTVNERFGDYTLTSARLLSAAGAVPDRISFGGVGELT
jgi:DNA polymerase IV